MSFTTVNITTNPDDPKFLYNINSYGAPLIRPGGTPLQAGDIWNDLDYGIARTYTATGEWRSPGVFDSSTNFSVGSAVIATTATTGFLYIPSCAGPPTGVPVVPYTGAIAMVFDSTNNQLYLRDGANWLKTVALT
jgi:hypothetical protein